MKCAAFDFEIARTDLIRMAQVAPAANGRHIEKFGYWMLRVHPLGYRAVGGDGRRFLVQEKQGRGVVRTTGSYALGIRASSTKCWADVLQMLRADTVMARWTADQPDQLFLTADTTDMCLLGCRDASQWPNEALFLECKSSYRATLDLRQCDLLQNALRGQIQNYRSYQAICCNTVVTLNAERRYLRVQIRGPAPTKSSTVVTLSDVVVGAESPQEVEVVCPATTLLDLLNYAEPHRYIQLELVMRGKQQILVARYGASDVVQDAIWIRDASAKTRERSLTFLRVRTKDELAEGQQAISQEEQEHEQANRR
jgi:hypothetical protein